MKILLISPVADPEIKTSEGLLIPQLALHILESLTPPEHEVKIVEEEMEDIDINEECDLVGISCMTSNAPRDTAFPKNSGKEVKRWFWAAFIRRFLAMRLCSIVMLW